LHPFVEHAIEALANLQDLILELAPCGGLRIAALDLVVKMVVVPRECV
jgi:hypothetical protein